MVLLKTVPLQRVPEPKGEKICRTFSLFFSSFHRDFHFPSSYFPLCRTPQQLGSTSSRSSRGSPLRRCKAIGITPGSTSLSSTSTSISSASPSMTPSALRELVTGASPSLLSGIPPASSSRPTLPYTTRSKKTQKNLIADNCQRKVSFHIGQSFAATGGHPRRPWTSSHSLWRAAAWHLQRRGPSCRTRGGATCAGPSLTP